MERGDAFQTRIPKLPLSSTRENAMKVEGTDFEEKEDGAMRKKKRTTTMIQRRRRTRDETIRVGFSTSTWHAGEACFSSVLCGCAASRLMMVIVTVILMQC